MKINTCTFLLLTLISGYVFGYECPPLKWKKAGTEFGFVPLIITDHSDTSFFCSNKNRNLIVDKRDGSIIGTKDGFVLHSNSRTYEGGFVVYESNKITVTNNNLDELWSKVIDSSSLLSVTQTHDSGYAALNAAKNGYEIIILSKNGNITTKFPLEKNIPYIDSSFNIDYKGIVKTNGGIVAYGTGSTSTSIFTDGIASKYSLSGTEIWLKILSGIEISDIIELDNGEIAFTGRTDPNSAGIIDISFFTQKLAKRLYFPDYSVPLIHLDSDGKVLLHKELGIFEFEQGQSLRKLNNLFFITYYSSMNNGSLAAYDIYAVNDSGNTVWSNTNLIPNNSVSFRITAQPFLSGDIAIVLFDTLSYYSIESAVKPQRTIKQTANDINCKVNGSNLCYTLNEPSQIVISLLTINGKVIKTFDHGLKPVGQHTLSLKGVSKGIYMVKFQTNKFSSVNKLIFN